MSSFFSIFSNQPPYINQQTGSIKDCLNKLEQEAPTESQKQEIFKKLAAEMVEKSKNWSSIDRRVFVHRMLAAYIDNKEYEGINSIQSVQYWIELLEKWQNSEGLFLPLPLTYFQYTQIISVLNNYKSIYTDILNDTDPINKNVSRALQKIKTFLNESSFAYIPVGYRATLINEGHATPLFIQKENKKIKCHFLNLGEGAHQHPTIEWNSLPRFSFRSFPITYDQQFFFDVLGPSLFTRIFRLQREEVQIDSVGYKAEDIYGAFALTGSVENRYDHDVKDYSKKLQLGATCGDKATELTIHDWLLMIGYHSDVIKRFFLNAKVCNLLMIYHTINKDPKKEDLELLQKALIEFSISLTMEKLPEKVCSQKEKWMCLALIEYLIEHIAVISKELHVQQELINFNTVLPTDFDHLHFEYLPIQSKNIEAISTEPSLELMTYQWKHDTFEIDQCIPLLQSWLNHSHVLNYEKKRLQLLHYLYEKLLSLPVPQTHEDKWNQLPLSEITDTLKLFSEIGYLCAANAIKPTYNSKHEKEYIERSKLFFILHTIYAVADKLARRKSGNLLNGFCSPFWLTAESVPNKLDENFLDFILPFGKENNRYQELKNYFSEIEKDNPLPLFEFHSVFFIKKFMDQLKSDSKDKAPTGHLIYLLQFLESAQSKGLKNINDKQFLFILHLMNDENRCYLPIDFHYLRTISFLNYQLGFDEFNGFHFSLVAQSQGVKWKQNTKTADLFFLLENGSTYRKQNNQLGYATHSHVASKHLEAGQKLTVNQIMCKKESIARDLSRIAAVPELSITSLIHWMNNNAIQLGNKDTQVFIELILFHPGRIQAQQKNNPKIIEELHKPLHNALNYYATSSQHLATWLFILRTQILIETFLPEPSQALVSIYQSAQYKFAHASSVEEQSVLALHLLLFFRFFSFNDHERATLMLKAWRIYNKHKHTSSPLWLAKEASYAIYSCHHQLVRLFTDSSFAQKQCDDFFNEFCPDSPNDSTQVWVGTYPIFSKGVFSINFYKCEIQKEGMNLTQFHFLDKLSSLGRRFIESCNTQFWEKNGVWLSNDNKIKIIECNGVFDIQKQIKAHTGCYWHSLVQNDYSISEHQRVVKFLKKNIEVDSLWQSQDAPVQQLIVIAKDQKKRHFIIYSKNDNGSTCEFQDSRGEILQLVNNSKLNNDYLESFLHKIDCIEKSLCWINKSLELELIELNDCNLEFRKQGKRFYLQQYPEFWIAEDQSLPCLSHFSGKIVIENGIEKKVIIPIRIIKAQYSHFEPNVSVAQLGIATHPKYFIYQLNASHLLNTAPLANLFLTLIFASERNFQSALYYLARAHQFEYVHTFDLIVINGNFCLDQLICSQFFKIEDNAPDALAFLLHFGLFIFDNHQQFLKNKLKNKESDLRKLAGWTKKTYEKYLSLMHSDVVNRIPFTIRLSHDQEIKLLNLLKPILVQEEKKEYQIWMSTVNSYSLNKIIQKTQENILAETFHSDFSWSKILETRLQILQSKEGLSSEIPFTHYYTVPRSYLFLQLCQDVEKLNKHSFDLPIWSPHQKPENNDFVRINYEDLLRSFVALYEKARQSKATTDIIDLDIFYILRGKERTSEDKNFFYYYATLLTIVRRNQTKFKEISLNNCQSQEELNERFKGLVTTAAQLQNRWLQKISGIKDLVTHSILFPYSYSNHVTLKRPPSFQPIQWDFKATGAFAVPNIDAKNISELNVLDFLKNQIVQFKNAKDTLKTMIEHEASQLNGSRLTKLTKEQFQQDHELRIKQIGQQLPNIQLDTILFRAILTKNLNLILAANPSLNPVIIKKIVGSSITFYLYSILLEQLEQLSKQIMIDGRVRETVFTRACQLFAFNLRFDPFENPELLLFQYRALKLLRMDQLELINWIFEAGIFLHSSKVDKLFYGLGAGAGKTSTIEPILMLKANNAGFLPIAMAPNTLINVDRESLKDKLNDFDHKLHVFELNLEVNYTADRLEHLYANLIEMHDNKGHLQITPRDYYAVNLFYFMSLEEADVEKVKWLSLIDDLFQTKGCVFIDECRLILSPKTRAKIGLGRAQKLPDRYIKLFIEIYKLLLIESLSPVLEDGRKICHVLNIAGNNQAQAAIVPEVIEHIKISLAKELVNHPLLNIPAEEKKSILNYLLNPTQSSSHINPSIKSLDLIDVARGYLNEFFAFVMKIKGEMRHGRSGKQDEEIDVPKQKRESTDAFYEDPFITLALSIHGTLQRGLDYQQCYRLLKELVKKQQEEESIEKRDESITVIFNSWVTKALGDEGVKPETQVRYQLSELSIHEERSVRFLFDVLHKQEDAIFWYIENIIGNQVVYHEEQLVSTPTHILNGFNKAIAFSATPGSEDLYSFYPENGSYFRKDHSFASSVMQRLSDADNQKIITITSTKLDLFFTELYQKDPTVFHNLNMINDIGGCFCDYSNIDVARAFFAFVKKMKLDFDGCFLFEKEAEATNAQLYFWHINWVEPRKISGSDIKAELRDFQLDFLQLKIVTLLDPSRGIGTNIPHENDLASVLLLVGEGLTRDDLIQALLRLRGFLKKQSVIWGIQEEFAQQISTLMKQPLSVKMLIEWSELNEKNDMITDMSMLGFEEIDFLCEKPARLELRKALTDPAKQIKIYQKYRNGFVKKNIQTASFRFGSAQIQMPAATLLTQYAKAAYEKFGYSEKWEKAQIVHQDVKKIIGKVSRYLPTLGSKSQLEMGRECYMHIQQMQQSEKEQISQQHGDLRAIIEVPLSSIVLTDPHLVTQLNALSDPIGQVFGSKHFTQNLRVSHNAIHTAASGGLPLGIKYFKDVVYVLVIGDDIKQAYALSDYEAATMQLKIAEKEIQCCKRKFLLMTSLGIEVCKNFSEIDSEKIKNSVWLNDILVDLSLISGKIYDIKRLAERLTNWDDFWPMWNSITLSQINSLTKDYQLLENLVPKEFKFEKSQNHPQQTTKTSFLNSFFNKEK